MAKKVISTIQKKGIKKFSKIIISKKEESSNNYKFQEKIVPADAVEEILKENQ